MKKKVRARRDILNGNIMEQMMIFLFPLFLGYLLQQLYSFADNIILGRLISKQALASVGGSANSLINILLNFISGITAAITVLVAQNYGRGNMEKVRSSIRTGICVSLLCGAILSILLVLVSPLWLDMMREPIENRPLSLTYLYFYFASLTFYFVYQTGISIFRATGDSRRPLLLIGIIAVAKITLDLLFAGVFRMGVFGTSLATFLSHLIGAAVVLFIFAHTQESYQFTLKEFGFDRDDTKKIFQIGLPFAIQSMMFAIPNALIQFKINSFGTDAIAAYSAYNSVDALFWCFSNAIGTATITMASQNFGNRNIPRVRKVLWTSSLLEAAGALLYGTVFLTFGKRLLSLFLKDAVPLDIAVRMLRTIAFSYLTTTFVETFSAVFKSCGMTKAPLLIAVGTICLSRIAYILIYPISDPILAIFAFPLSWIITSLAYLTYYLCRRDVFRQS